MSDESDVANVAVTQLDLQAPLTPEKSLLPGPGVTRSIRGSKSLKPINGEPRVRGNSDTGSDESPGWELDTEYLQKGNPIQLRSQALSPCPQLTEHSSFTDLSSSPAHLSFSSLELDDVSCAECTSADDDLLIARDSFKGTGTEGIVYETRLQSESTVITDAGDQQFKRQADILQTTNAQPETGLSEQKTDPFLSNDQSLHEKLHNALVEPHDSRKPAFIPKRTLNELINITSVSIELKTSLSHLSRKRRLALAKIICDDTVVIRDDGKEKIRSYRAIFALLVMLDRSRSISSFIREMVSDLDLPLVFSTDHPHELRRRDTERLPSNQKLRCFSEWKPFIVDHFEQQQWKVLAPFFAHSKFNFVPHYHLEKQHILPFLPCDGHNDDTTGISRVFMVRIHREHHDFPNIWLCERGFAIKELYKDDKKEFKKEIEILKKFTGDKAHPHVVTLLATYEQYDKYNLIFYRADGNLFDYWKTINPHPVFNYSSVLFLAEQCYGIAHGLLRLHRHSTPPLKASSIPSHLEVEDLKRRFSNTVTGCDEKQADLKPAELVNRPVDESGDLVEQFGRHGDLKPENILWYSGPETESKGTLKITDFGASEINSRGTKTKRRSQIQKTPTYSPPECYMHHHIIRQSYDIWSLACVYLEFVTWLLGGCELLMEFAKQRVGYDVIKNFQNDIFFQIVRNGNTDETSAIVKPSVTKFIDKLHAHPNCTDYLHELLELIQNDMLVVEPRDLNKTRRLYCEEVSIALKKKYENCLKNSQYAIGKSPWCNRQPNAGNPLTEPVTISMTEENEKLVAESRDKLPVY